MIIQPSPLHTCRFGNVYRQGPTGASSKEDTRTAEFKELCNQKVMKLPDGKELKVADFLAGLYKDGPTGLPPDMIYLMVKK